MSGKSEVKAAVESEKTTKCEFPACDRPAEVKGKCLGHYQQFRRNGEMKPLHKQGLVMLPGSVRVDPDVHEALLKRVTDGKAPSLYDAERQAIEAGVKAWLVEGVGKKKSA